MNYDIQCYIQPDGGSAFNTKSLWEGMYNLEAKGLADYGKAKNIVTESYADGAALRTFIPSGTPITREATDVSLKMLFIDTSKSNRYDQYDSFVAYVENKLIYYWDSVRKRKVHLAFVDKTSPEEHFKGNLPYIEATFKFKNVDGKPTEVPKYTYSWSDLVCVRIDGLNNGVGRYDRVDMYFGGIGIAVGYITDAFLTYSAITYANLADMSESNYLSRLNAFSNYVISQMETSGFVDFSSDVNNSIKDGAYGRTVLCPLQAWETPPERSSEPNENDSPNKITLTQREEQTQS